MQVNVSHQLVSFYFFNFDLAVLVFAAAGGLSLAVAKGGYALIVV